MKRKDYVSPQADVQEFELKDIIMGTTASGAEEAEIPEEGELNEEEEPEPGTEG